MARKILNDGEIGLSFRTKLNDNFEELYELAETISAWYTSASSVQTFNTTPQALTYLDTMAHEHGITYDEALGKFSVVKAGGFDFTMFFSASWANGAEVYFSAWVDGVQRGNEFIATGLGNPKETTVVIPTFVRIPANGTFEIRARVDSGTRDVTFNAGTTKLDMSFYT